MPTHAELYKVRGPNGIYYAVHVPSTGQLWTERSDHSARAQAHDAGLELGTEKAITHEALMRLSGRGNSATQMPAPARSARPAPAEAASSPAPIKSRTAFLAADSGQAVLTNKSGQDGAVFSSASPVVPLASTPSDEPGNLSTGALLNRDVLNEKRKLPRGTGKNPFADRKPKRRS